MACRICKRGSCTESFHSMEEQDGAEERLALEEKVRRMKRLAQSLDAGSDELPYWAQLRVSALLAVADDRLLVADGDSDS